LHCVSSCIWKYRKGTKALISPADGDQPAKALPLDWRNEPPPHATQAIGLDWAKRNETALLRAPSVIVPREDNCLLNPRHPAFAKPKNPAARAVRLRQQDVEVTG